MPIEDVLPVSIKASGLCKGCQLGFFREEYEGKFYHEWEGRAYPCTDDAPEGATNEPA